MMLAETLLEKLNAGLPENGPQTLTHQSGDWSATLTVDRADSIGCLVRDITCTRTAVDVSPLPVRDWANAVADRAVGLLEPLQVIEIDIEQNDAILRSSSPTRKGDQAGYYEVRLNNRGTATVNRYQADVKAGTRREAVPFALTHEVIANLAQAVCVDRPA